MFTIDDGNRGSSLEKSKYIEIYKEKSKETYAFGC